MRLLLPSLSRGISFPLLEYLFAFLHCFTVVSYDRIVLLPTLEKNLSHVSKTSD